MVYKGYFLPGKLGCSYNSGLISKPQHASSTFVTSHICEATEHNNCDKADKKRDTVTKFQI